MHKFIDIPKITNPITIRYILFGKPKIKDGPMSIKALDDIIKLKMNYNFLGVLAKMMGNKMAVTTLGKLRMAK